MQGQPFISVVMCTYNGALFLDEQILTIINQEMVELELIILDDCSTDGTWQKLRDWQAANKSIKIFRNEKNIGYNKNFEKAIQLATSDFIALSDQDDIWLPQKLIKLYKAFTSNEIVLVHSRSVKFENNDKKLRYDLAKLHRHYTGNDTKRFFFSNHIMGHDVMFRKFLVGHIVPIPEGMSYDWWISLTATCYGTIGSVNEFLIHHRIHGNNSFFSKDAASKKKELDMPDMMQLFATIKGLKPNDKMYLQQFLQLLLDKQRYKKDGFYPPLFRFMFKNRQLIFGHKKRFLPIFSQLKNAIKYAKMDYEGRGLTI